MSFPLYVHIESFSGNINKFSFTMSIYRFKNGGMVSKQYLYGPVLKYQKCNMTPHIHYCFRNKLKSKELISETI